MPIDIDGLSFEELLDLNQRVVARLKMLESMQAHIEMMQFNLGQQVSFEHQGGVCSRPWSNTTARPSLWSPTTASAGISRPTCYRR
ncbi:hypothetical protein [Thiolapillus sp.]|uniref:hypothetical protein n=1 Tax=Thiolapillus sp. TaxID=2017437 RepID=UPI003AF5F1C3